MNRMTKEYINSRMQNKIEKDLINNYINLYGKSDTINILKDISDHYYAEHMIYNKCYGHIFDIGFYIKYITSYSDELINILFNAINELEEKYNINIRRIIDKRIGSHLLHGDSRSLSIKFHTLKEFFQLLNQKDNLSRKSIKKALMEFRLSNKGVY